MIARRLNIRGRVQGVFYRGWTVETAQSLGLTGWVRNLSSGEVEIFAQGPPDRVALLIESCSRGPAAARVDEVMVEEAAPAALQGFTTRPTP